MRRLHPVCLVALASLLCAPSLKAQAPASRIVAPVDDASRVTLAGSLSTLDRPEFDTGAASPSAVIPFARLVLTRSQAQQAALEKFMAQQIDPRSPNYLHWLTPAQFASLYGPSDSDIAAITGWLQSRGFTAVQVNSGHTAIAFTGSVSQIESAFSTSIHTFQHDGQQYLGNVTAPQIPSALAPVVMGVAGLNTFKPRSHLARGPAGHYDPQLQQFVKQSPETSGPTPEFTPVFQGVSYLYMVPADAATIYDSPNSYNGNWSSSVSYNGSGVTIGIGGDAAINTSVVQNYRKLFLNGDTTAPTVTNVGNSAVTCPASAQSCDEDEAYLDNEVAGGMAPGATIHFYTAGNSQNGIEGAVEQMLSDNAVDIFSLSFGLCEDFLTTAQNTYINQLWSQAAMAGIAVTVSTGDSGSAGCDDPGGQQAVYGLAVSGFSSTPNNIAVGGTDFYGLIESSNSFSTYVNTNVTSANSYRSAKGYIPETPWNDTSTNIGLLANNVTYLYQGLSNDTGGTGGASACTTNSTTDSQQTGQPIPGACTSGYPKPSWQVGPGVPPDNARDVPDVSLMAGNGFYAGAWLVCSDVDTTPVGVTNYKNDCSSQTSAQYGFYFDGFGGTSASTPAFAGILAMVQQKVGHRLGKTALQTIYGIFNNNNAGASAAFHDITTGNNSVPCKPGTPNCQNYSAGNNFLTGYNTGVGYDLATGIGSVDANLLVQAWAGGSTFGTGVATVTASATSASINASQTDTVNVTVTGSAGLGTPTGSVTLSGGGFTSQATKLVSGAASISIPANALTVGSDVMTATYTGDSNYAANATGTTTITVAAAPTYSMSGPSGNVTASQGSNATAQVTLKSDGVYAGTVAVTCALATSPSGATDAPGCSATSGSPITFSPTSTQGSVTLTFTTTAASSSSLQRQGLPGWLSAGGGTALALLVFFGIPARRRGWRNLLGLVIVFAALGSLSACGGGGSSTPPPPTNPGTTKGTYTFTVTGAGNPAINPAPTATVTLVVQ